MKPAHVAAASLLVFTVFGAGAPRGSAAEPDGTVSPDALPAPTPSYTFHMDVAMAMLHFPWLHFHMDGLGEYQPGASYDVRFSKVPWFFPKQHDEIDLSMLDPLMWPSRFTFAQTGRQSDERIFELHAISEPEMREATVAIGPRGCARRLDATYQDGTTIHMQVQNSNVDGFFVPQHLSANINEPHFALSADAAFKDYDFGTVSARDDKGWI